MRALTRMRWLLLAVGLVHGSAAHANAANCTYSASGLNFGTVIGNPVPQTDTTGNIQITCSGTTGTTIRVCIALPVGGGGGSYASRLMRNGVANTVTFNLYKDAARAQPWGFVGVSPYPKAVDIPIVIATGNVANVPIYGRLNAQAGPKPSGVYTSDFNNPIQAEGRETTTSTSCDNFAVNGTRQPFGFTSTVNIAPSCTLAANNLNFGTLSTLGVQTDSSSSLSVNCTNGTPYTIALNGGTVSGSIASRKLSTTGNAPGVVAYQIYKDAARTTVWGDGVTGFTLAGTGTGATVAVPTYGRLPAQSTPATGNYRDTVTATLSY